MWAATSQMLRYSSGSSKGSNNLSGGCAVIWEFAERPLQNDDFLVSSPDNRDHHALSKSRVSSLDLPSRNVIPSYRRNREIAQSRQKVTHHTDDEAPECGRSHRRVRPRHLRHFIFHGLVVWRRKRLPSFSPQVGKDSPAIGRAIRSDRDACPSGRPAAQLVTRRVP